MKVPGQRSQGADVFDGVVRYRTWAPGKNKVEVVIFGRANSIDRVLSLGEEPSGYFSAVDPHGRVGDRYKYRFEGNEWPDPASRFNPDGVHGAAAVIDPGDFAWHDQSWRAPPLAELVIYELHIGTFTLEG